jgi:hypothetical protein
MVSQHDWSLHRKGQIDQERHKQKIKEAIKKNLANIVSEESIILSDGKRVLKVPIRSLDEYRFRYDFNKQQHAGQGDGESQVGDVIARDPRPGRGKRGEAGEEPGADYYEAEITLDELAAMIFEDLGLPNLEEKKLAEMESEAVRFTDVRKVGPLANLDKRRTIMENIKRNAAKGDPHFGGIRNEDLRFKTWEPTIKYQSNAVVMAMMDVSGSMGEFEKYIARSFYFWMVRFLRTKYNNVKIVFISHHTEAYEVGEEEFFHKGESGGTFISSAYVKALDIIKERYHPSLWNIYAFHCSDGDNFDSDNPTALRAAKELSEVCNLFGYGEIKPLGSRYYESSMLNVFRRLDADNFQTVLIERKEDIWPSFKAFLGRDRALAEA